MKKIHFFFLPSLVAGLAYLLATGTASAQETIYVTNNGSDFPGASSVEEISVAANGTATYTTFTTQDLNEPTGIAFNSAGDVFVANNGSGTIAEFSPGGSFIGNYATGQANPRGLVFDSIGNLYVADQGSGKVVEIPFGSPMGTTGTVVAQNLGAANGLAMYNGTLYVTDGNDSTVDTISGGIATPIATSTQGVVYPNGIAFDSSGHMFLINQGAAPTISEYDSHGNPIKTVTSLSASLNPKSIALDSAGDYYVTDYNQDEVTEYNSAGVLIKTFNTAGDLFNPDFIAVLPGSNNAVPEPSVYALLAASMGLVYFLSRNKLVLAEAA